MAQSTHPGDRALSRRPTTSEGAHLLAEALERYVRVVAEALGVPHHGISCEVTDTATAYLALGCRAAAHPGRDVMLVWSATHGWAVSIETRPGEPLIALAQLTGDVVQAPEAVARLVADATTRLDVQPVPAVTARPMGWSDLAECMDRYAPAAGADGRSV